MKIQSQADINTQNLLNNMAQMPVSELEYFVGEVNALISQKKTNDSANREKLLFSKINKTVLSKNLRERYLVLAEKLEDETISEIEHNEFATLTKKDETLRNERVKYLIELSQLQGVSLKKVMENLGLGNQNAR